MVKSMRGRSSDIANDSDESAMHQSRSVSPWGHSRAKNKLIEMFTDPSIDAFNKNASDVYDSYEIFQKYKKENFINNFNRLKSKMQETQDGQERQGGETKKKKREKDWQYSEEKMFLRQALFDEHSRIHKMDTVLEVYNSRSEFQRFDYISFERNFKALRDQVKKELCIADRDNELFEKIKHMYKRQPLTKYGYPFWDTHEATKLLEEDLRQGHHVGLSPCEMHEMRKEYQEFPLEIFRNQLYREKRRQKEGVYWQMKRNRTAKKLHEQQVAEMRGDWETEQVASKSRKVWEKMKNEG